MGGPNPILNVRESLASDIFLKQPARCSYLARISNGLIQRTRRGINSREREQAGECSEFKFPAAN